MSERRLPLRLLCVLTACSALAGCIFPPEMRSRSVEIPTMERGLDPDLVGTWWLFDQGADRSDFRIFRIRQAPDRTYRLSYAERSNPNDETGTDDLDGKVVLLKSAQPGIDLLLFTNNEGTLYALALHSRAGSLALFPFIAEADTAIGKGRIEYLATIAARHGISLARDKDSDAMILGGRLDRKSLVALFSDAEFLGGLRLDPDEAMILLPANRPLPPLGDRLAWWPPASPWQLVSDRYPIAPAELVQPSGLIGRFREGMAAVTITAQPDGSLLADYAPDPDSGYRREPRRIRLVGIGEVGRLLAVVEQSEFTGEDRPARLVFGYFLVSQGSAGTWSFAPLLTAANDLSRPLDEAAGEIRRRAAARHGLILSGSSLTGARDLATIKALLTDRQFQAGLDARDAQAWFELTPVAAGQP